MHGLCHTWRAHDLTLKAKGRERLGRATLMPRDCSSALIFSLLASRSPNRVSRCSTRRTFRPSLKRWICLDRLKQVDLLLKLSVFLKTFKSYKLSALKRILFSLYNSKTETWTKLSSSLKVVAEEESSLCAHDSFTTTTATTTYASASLPIYFHNEITSVIMRPEKREEKLYFRVCTCIYWTSRSRGLSTSCSATHTRGGVTQDSWEGG